MSASELLERLKAIPPGGELDFVRIRQEILDEYENVTNTDDRVMCLAMFKVVMDTIERQLEQHGKTTPAQLAEFKEARRIDYHSLIIQEATVGENVCVETLGAITKREIAAGRMAPDNSLRRIALDRIAAPHLTHSELIAIETEKQIQPTSPTSPKAYPARAWGRILNWLRGI